MDTNRVYQILISMVVITTVSLIGDRWRVLGGIIASMPLTIPLTLWIVFSNTGGDYVLSAEFARAATIGLVATFAFAVTSWWALRQGWPIARVILVGYTAWGLVTGIQWLMGRH
ncbi:MAG: hypothetical protein H5T64_03560 [Chloroflexi bacterium]|nr:hypothetical protein [Chloroflexota bacterium]